MTDNNNIIEKDGKSTLKKGLLWQHKDKLFSRWKERYFVLTKDYLSCFKKATKIANSDMGAFIFKLNLVDMEGLRWLNCTQKSKDSDVIVLELSKKHGPNILLRGENLMDWFIMLQKTIGVSKERREVLRSSSSSLPRAVLTSKLSEGKVAISPHLYALQHTMSDSTLGTRTSQSSDSNVDRTNLKNVSDHQRTPHLHKRNRISILADLDVNDDLKIPPSDVDADLGIDLDTPSPQTTPVQITNRKQIGKSPGSHRGLVKSYSHVVQPISREYLCTSSPAINRQRHSKSDVCFTELISAGNSSSQYWGRESPVLSQGSAYAKHVLSSPIAGSRRNKKYSSFIESPGRMKKNKGGAKNAATEFAFMQPVSSKRRARTLPDNRHLNRKPTSEPGSVQSQRFSVYHDHKAPPTRDSLSKVSSHPKQMSYGLLRFIDSDSPSPEL